MWRAKLRFLLLPFLAGLILLVVWHLRHQEPAHLPQKYPTPVQRLAELQRLVSEQENTSHRAIERYNPTLKWQLTDLTFPARDLLACLPGVTEVEQVVKCDKPTRRLIHLGDWHLVPRDLYALDLATSAGRPLAEAEVAQLHAEHLLEVAAVQAEQLVVLRCLIRHHGLKKVYCEGLTPAGLANYRDIIRALKAMEADEIPAARKQLAEVRELLAGMKARGQEDTERHLAAVGIESQLVKMLGDHRDRLLEFGAAGRLLVAGELEEVLPLDDDDALESSRPVTPDGRVKIDKGKTRAREEAQVKLILAGEPLAVVILGGDHDLGLPLRVASGGRAEYVRVTTALFRRLSSP